MQPQPERFPKPGTVLWAVDIALERDVFRSGAATKPNTDYLRYSDLGMDAPEGRIEPEMQEKFSVKPGQGISLFLERMIPEGMVVMDAAEWKKIEKKAQRKVHWWGIEQRQPIPAGLSLVYDGHPPGHCTLTVTREMTVKAFLALVSAVTFTQKGADLIGPKTA